MRELSVIILSAVALVLLFALGVYLHDTKVAMAAVASAGLAYVAQTFAFHDVYRWNAVFALGSVFLWATGFFWAIP